MTYYHGTKAEFKEFTHKGSGKHGLGFYFTPDRNEAIYFAESLSGDGSSTSPKIYTVDISPQNLFNTMDASLCKQVCGSLGIDYKIPSSVGGAKEHYHHLEAQLVRKDLIEKHGLNKLLEDLGFDGVIYDLMEHIIIFNPDLIKIISVEEI